MKALIGIGIVCLILLAVLIKGIWGMVGEEMEARDRELP